LEPLEQVGHALAIGHNEVERDAVVVKEVLRGSERCGEKGGMDGPDGSLASSSKMFDNENR
jgi:hypothetical protein